MTIRDFQPDDAAAVDALARAAFEQYQGRYDDWPAFMCNVGAMSRLAKAGELIVAQTKGRIAGAVGYVGPNRPKPAQFDPSWAIIRMLAVDPLARGQGLGRALTLECLHRAERDRSAVVALHTARSWRLRLPCTCGWGSQLTRKAPRSWERRPRSTSRSLRPKGTQG